MNNQAEATLTFLGHKMQLQKRPSTITLFTDVHFRGKIGKLLALIPSLITIVIVCALGKHVEPKSPFHRQENGGQVISKCIYIWANINTQLKIKTKPSSSGVNLDELP